MTHDPLVSATSVTVDRPRAPLKNAVLAGLASYLDSATIVSTSIALVIFQAAFGLTSLSIGVLSSLLTLTIALGALVGGRLGDMVGRKRVYSVDLLVYTAGIVILLCAVNTPMLYVGVVVAGLAMGADIPTSLALIAETSPEGRRGRMVSVSSMLWLVGIVAVTVLAALFADLGMTGARILYAHLLIVAVITWFLRRSMRESAEWRQASDSGPRETAGETLRASARQLLRPVLLMPLVMTGLYYTLWNLCANTLGQFSTYLYVNVAHTEVSTASMLGLIGMPLGLGTTYVFMRIADSRLRRVFFVIGAVLQVVGYATPVVLGFSTTSLFLLSLAGGIGQSFAGEAIYKVWSQEFFPTLLRSTAQGITYGVTRALTAGFAVVTPSIAASDPQLLVGLLAGFMLGSGLIGGLVIPALERSRGTAPWAKPSSSSPSPSGTASDAAPNAV
ncbi:MFS transporter [Streptomyces sp. NPDC088812]|uniref:MFS transporter n=1 Tax=Streptomyces sp. NPDC088812 TaxID=3365905 RepID=UPI003807DFD0